MAREFLDTCFFVPLAMTATSVLNQWKILKHRAQGYTIRDGELVNIRRVAQVELPVACPADAAFEHVAHAGCTSRVGFSLRASRGLFPPYELLNSAQQE